jgi:hypothetical protein
MENKRSHLSASQLEMFARCPESWRRRYVEKEVIPPRVVALRGKAVHAGAELNMRQKIESHIDLPTGEIVEAAVAHFNDAIKHDAYDASDKQNIGKTKDVVVEMAMAHAAEQAPNYQPVAVEEKFRLELPSVSHDLVGVIDLRTDKGEVVDFKTAGKLMNRDEAENSTQLTVYAAAQADRDNTDVTVKLDVLVEPTVKLGVRRQVIEATRNKTDLPIIARRVAAVSRQIDAGLFPPAATGAWWCSESWCGYWSTCQYVNAERIAAS